MIAVADFTLKGREAPICQPDLLSSEVCCSPGAWIRGVAERLPGLVSPTDYNPLLVVHVDASNVDSILRSIKKDYRALRKIVRVSGAQVVFSSIFQVKAEDLEKANLLG